MDNMDTMNTMGLGSEILEVQEQRDMNQQDCAPSDFSAAATSVFLTSVVWSMRGQCFLAISYSQSSQTVDLYGNDTISIHVQKRDNGLLAFNGLNQKLAVTKLLTTLHILHDNSDNIFEKRLGAGNHVEAASSAIQSSHVAIWFSVLSAGAC